MGVLHTTAGPPALRHPVSFAAPMLALLLAMADPAAAQTAPLSARDSDPLRLQWMTGFPPAPERQITNPASDFFSFPKMRWSVCHLRTFLPTAQVSRGLGPARPLPVAPDPAIDALTFTPLNGDAPMTWAASLAANYTDGIVILHRGTIVYERYAGCLQQDGKHAAMSMTKSFTGTLAEILVAEGALDDTAFVRDIVPELADSAFGTATVRQVMDMTTAIRFSENYADPAADIWAYNAAADPFPRAPGDDGPNGYFAYLQTVRPDPRPDVTHGDEFHYRTVNSDVLGWIVSRVSGMAVTDLLSARLWRPMGAEQDAYMTVDGLGTPFAGGGLSAGLRDLGRFGQLMLDGGVVDGQRLFPAAVVERIRQGGDRAAFRAAGYATLPGASYRSQWWVLHNANGAFAARGVHGQTIYVDPTAEMVIARFASHPSPFNAAIDPTSLPAFDAVAAHLLSGD